MSKDKEDRDFPEKYKKKLPTGFAEDAESLDEEGLKKKILEAEGNLSNVEREMDADQKLQAAKDDVKDLAAAYKDAAAAQKAKIKYCVFLLETRGTPLGG